jgi:hypothetical protein
MREVNNLRADLEYDQAGMRDRDLDTWISWALVELTRAQHNASYSSSPIARDTAMCNVLKAFATLFLAVGYNARKDT